jgi:hypothetical protein
MLTLSKKRDIKKVIPARIIMIKVSNKLQGSNFVFTTIFPSKINPVKNPPPKRINLLIIFFHLLLLALKII